MIHFACVLIYIIVDFVHIYGDIVCLFLKAKGLYNKKPS